MISGTAHTLAFLSTFGMHREFYYGRGDGRTQESGSRCVERAAIGLDLLGSLQEMGILMSAYVSYVRILKVLRANAPPNTTSKS